MPTRNWGSKGPLKTGSCGTLVLPGTLLIRGLSKFLIGFFVVNGEPTGGSGPDDLTPPHGAHRQLYPVTSGHPFRLPTVPVLLGLDTGPVTCLEDGRDIGDPILYWMSQPLSSGKAFPLEISTLEFVWCGTR